MEKENVLLTWQMKEWIKLMEIIRIGNIEKNDLKKKTPDLYLGSGDMGASFDAFGTTDSSERMGFLHGDLYMTDPVYNMDFHVMPLKMKFENMEADGIIDYNQKLDIFDGILETAWWTKDYHFVGKLGFHTEKRDIFAAEYEWEGTGLPVLSFSSGIEYTSTTGGYAVTEIRDICSCDGILQVRIQAGRTEALVKLQVSGDAELTYANKKILVRFRNTSGKASVLMAMGKMERARDLEEQLEGISKNLVMAEIADSWHRKWGDSRISFDGHEELLKFYYRGIYHILCSQSDNKRFVGPSMGWAGRDWRFHFPQDFEYIAPVLLRLGYIDIVKAKVEMYTTYIEALKENTKRIFQCEGVLWTWEFPIGDGRNHLPEGKAPYKYVHEIHNSVYPTKLVWETACFVPDINWRKTYAWKIIKESADFYMSGAKFNGKTWDIDIHPAMGQDELGGVDQKNYLCALYAAKYVLSTAIKAAKEWGIPCKEAIKWNKILSDGLAFDKLLQPEFKVYMNYEGDWKQYRLGLMKHPIPLNPISFIPLGELNEYEQNAYNRRYELCVPLPQICGWTLADIILATAHMGDNEAFWEGIHLLSATDMIDEEWSVAYESSGSYERYPYTASEGLICDAILNGIVCDFFGKVRYHGIKFKNVKYRNLHLLDGNVVSNWE